MSETFFSIAQCIFHIFDIYARRMALSSYGRSSSIAEKDLRERRATTTILQDGAFRSIQKVT